MRLTILVDIIAIPAGIAIILVSADDRSGDATEHCANGRARARSDAGKD